MQNAAILSQEDIERLLSEPTWHVRKDVADKVSGRYSTGHFEGREIAIAEQIFRLLLKDTEVQVRQAMAEQLKDNKDVPRDIIINLAKDVADVSMPVLEASELLNDTDLLGIIDSSKEIRRLVAIARRKKVSMRVSKKLVDTGHEDVVVNLVRNQGADIAEESFEKILEDFAGKASIVNTVVERAHLPATVVEKLIALVSHKVADELARKYNIPSTQIMVESESTREIATLRLIDRNVNQLEVDQLVVQLMAFRRLTPSIILSGLCRGNFRFFETALARLANIPLANARTLINDRGELGFQALYNKAKLPSSMYLAVKLALRAARTLQDEGKSAGSKIYANQVVERILEFSRNEEVDNLAYIIALVRQNNSSDKHF